MMAELSHTEGRGKESDNEEELLEVSSPPPKQIIINK